MALPNGIASARYRVIYTEVVRTALKQLGNRARELGITSKFVAALKGLEQRLQTDPLELGEPLRDFVDAGLEERLGGYSFLFVRYGVDRARLLVYVVECTAVGHDF